MKQIFNLFCILSVTYLECFEQSPITVKTKVKNGHNQISPTQAKDETQNTVLTKFIRMPVDHFDRKNKRKWYMKYYQNLAFWKPKSPVYLFVGGNAPLTPKILLEGFMFDMANETGGVMFGAEHRFYGENNNLKDLTFLTSDQAIADIEFLLDEVKEVPAYQDSKVVLIGGGYGGSLAVWLKAQYPDTIDAVVASGAPLVAKADFHEYMQHTGFTYLKFMPRACAEQLIEVFQTYYFCLRDTYVAQCISKRGINTPICDNVNMQHKANQHLFLLSEISYLTSIAERGFKPIGKVCEMLKFSKRRGANLFWVESQQCYDYDYARFLVTIRQKVNEPYRHWMYQCCNEFGFFHTSTTVREPFNTFLPLDAFYRNCNNLFGPHFDRNRITEGIKRTNEKYGKRRPNVTNVIFVQGELDPWKHLGVVEAFNKNDVVIIPGASHCRDLLPRLETDSKALQKARKKIKILLKFMLGLEDE